MKRVFALVLAYLILAVPFTLWTLALWTAKTMSYSERLGWTGGLAVGYFTAAGLIAVGILGFEP
jgi:hypothetical protein